MRKKFKIMSPQDHPDPDKRGKRYKPAKNHMAVMSSSGVFFIAVLNDYDMYVRKLSAILPKYDVVWK